MVNNKYSKSLQELRAKMKEYRGSITRTANKGGWSTYWVYRVINGQSVSEDVISTALEVLKEMKAEQEKAKNKKSNKLQDLQVAIHNGLAAISA